MNLILEGNTDGSFVIGITKDADSAEQMIVERFHSSSSDGDSLVCGDYHMQYQGLPLSIKLYTVQYNPADYMEGLDDLHEFSGDLIWGVYVVEEGGSLELTQEPFGFLELTPGFPFVDDTPVTTIATHQQREIA